MSDVQADIGALASFTVVADPALKGQPGEQLRFTQATPQFPVPLARATSLANWHVFEGMVLAVVFADGATYTILGSAVLVAPGLALCATHVIGPNVEDLRSGKLSVLCFGIASHGAQGWRIREVKLAPPSDVCLLGLEYCAALPPGREFLMASISTRLPAIGETLSVVGFRAAAQAFPTMADGRMELAARLLMCAGEVTQQFPHHRDSVMAPWPSLEINCPAWGGMSGGPVFDSRGFLVGLVATSFETDADPAPMLASLLWPVLGQKCLRGWPTGVEQRPMSLLEMHGHLCIIDGVGAVTVRAGTDATQLVTDYVAWS